MTETFPSSSDPPQSPLDLVRQAARLTVDRISKRDEVIRKEQEQRDEDVRLLRHLADLLQQHGEPPLATGPDSGVDTVLHSEDGITTVVQAKRSNAFDASDGPGNTRETVLRLLADAGRPMQTSEIIAGVKRVGVDSQSATVRSLISRMADSGQIEKLRRGLYQLGSASAHGQTVWVEPHQRGSARVRGHYRLDEPAGRIWTTSVVQTPTLQQFFAQPTDGDDEVPEPSDAEYSEMNRDAARAHLEDQAPVAAGVDVDGSLIQRTTTQTTRDSDVAEYTDRPQRSDHESSAHDAEATPADQARMEGAP